MYSILSSPLFCVRAGSFFIWITSSATAPAMIASTDELSQSSTDGGKAAPKDASHSKDGDKSAAKTRPVNEVDQNPGEETAKSAAEAAKQGTPKTV